MDKPNKIGTISNLWSECNAQTMTLTEVLGLAYEAGYAAAALATASQQPATAEFYQLFARGLLVGETAHSIQPLQHFGVRYADGHGMPLSDLYIMVHTCGCCGTRVPLDRRIAT